MKRASIRDLHIRTSEIVREVAEGGVVVIERRGEPVAELRPVVAAAGIPVEAKAAIFAAMQDLWARLPEGGDSTASIGEDRDR